MSRRVLKSFSRMKHRDIGSNTVTRLVYCPKKVELMGEVDAEYIAEPFGV